MSIRLLTQVWETAPVKGGDLLVLLAMADFANEHGMCWPSMKSLAKKARLSERQVQRTIQALREKNLITEKGWAEGYGTRRFKIHLTGLRQNVTPPKATEKMSQMSPYPSYPSDTDKPSKTLKLVVNNDSDDFLEQRYIRGKAK